jgi:hypothetical protein
MHEMTEGADGSLARRAAAHIMRGTLPLLALAVLLLRDPGYEVEVSSYWSAPGEKTSAVQWVNALRDNLQSFSRGINANKLSDTSGEIVRVAYGPNYARLAEIKKKYDPTNVLRLNPNIRPEKLSNN